MSSQSVEINAEANFIQVSVSTAVPSVVNAKTVLIVSGRLTAQRARTRPVMRPGIKEIKVSREEARQRIRACFFLEVSVHWW